MKNDINNIKQNINYILDNELKEKVTKEQLQELKQETLEILKDKITDYYTKSNLIYQNKELIIIETVEELQKIKTPVFDINDKITSYKQKYNLNNNRLDKEVTYIINDNFIKVAKSVIQDQQNITKENSKSLTDRVEHILYMNLAQLIEEKYDKNIVIKLLKSGTYYKCLVTDNKLSDTKELQEAYIKATPKVVKRLNLLENKYVEVEEKTIRIPLIWKIYAFSKALEKVTKNWGYK